MLQAKCAYLEHHIRRRVEASEKKLEIALVRQQLCALERKANTKVRLSKAEKLLRVVFVEKLKGSV